MFYKKRKKEEAVYSSTGLSDLLSSPVFYSVIALTFVLGLSSIFGFFNNPRKLKTVVDVISQKILINSNSNTVLYQEDADYLLQKYSLKALEIKLDKPSLSKNSDSNPYKLATKSIALDSDSNLNSNYKMKAQKVSFDYDITSKQFWGDLDASKIESAFEESYRQDRDALMIGAPLSSDYSLEQGDRKYSMTAGILTL